MSKLGQRTPVNPDSILGRYVALCHTPRPLQPASGPPGNPEATPECDADKTGISHYVVASGKGIGFDHSGAIMVSWAERGVDPFEHQTCAVSP